MIKSLIVSSAANLVFVANSDRVLVIIENDINISLTFEVLVVIVSGIKCLHLFS
jgi:hypothetical protein